MPERFWSFIEVIGFSFTTVKVILSFVAANAVLTETESNSAAANRFFFIFLQFMFGLFLIVRLFYLLRMNSSTSSAW